MISRKLKIGMVCPYGWDTPGGVQIHIKELAEYFIAQGHLVSVIAPVSDENYHAQPWLVSAGRPVPIPFNGAVARVLFGPIASSRIKQWIGQGDFDLIHLHEPAIPSLSLLACWAAEGAMVATFHAAAPKQKAIYAIGPILEPLLEKLTARIAVSEMARQTLKMHFETDAVVIPNGIDIAKYRKALPNPEWKRANTIGFLGRFDEPRKGLSVVLDALAIVARFVPDVQVLIAGPGDSTDLMKKLDSGLTKRVKFLGRLTDDAKASFFKSLTIYVAPNLHGESFGIILAEAMAAGTPIVASDIPAFSQLLNGGEVGSLFKSGDPTDLAKILIRLLKDENERAKFSQRGSEAAKALDWEVVANQISDIYELALTGNGKVTLTSNNRSWKRGKSIE